jgi:DNA-directed RNA polymerase specialized sigma subunit
MEELAQSVGNEKMPGEFDWDAATVVDPNTNDGGSFQHLVDSNPALGREQVLSLLSQKIAQLTPGPKKVLAMHFHEHLGLSEIAACIGVTESRIRQIHDQTVALLRDYLWRASKPAARVFHKSLI